MFQIGFLLCLVGLTVGGPAVTKTREEIESFKNFLKKSRTENDVRLSERMLANPLASAWQNSGKFEGDILLDDWQVEGIVQEFAAGRNAYVWPNTNWPNNTIVYEFAPGDFKKRQQRAILKAMRDIEKKTCLKFRQRSPGEFNYVKITGAEDGCYADVGYWHRRGPHILNLARDRPGRGCFLYTTIIHEWFHILGFYHMQSTYNRDDYVRVIWENVEPGMEFNFESYESNIVQNLDLPYDYTSCMHYGPYSFSGNGNPTLVPLRSFEGEMGQEDYVTEYDWLRVNRHYNCPGAWSTDEPELHSEPVENETVKVVEEETPLDVENDA
ncbi:unnamed protein product [Parnassius mnemosyne]|uniref:Metalloendopeptidase n=1 Tax=Parnassius mnemosyne TaxID=213953 RepID=A0AAV1LVK1_9NEOP